MIGPEGIYYFEKGVPSSRAIAHTRRLPDVTQPLAPLTKQRATATLRTVAAALLRVACSIISVRGLCVGDARRTSMSTAQKSMTRMKAIPLRSVLDMATVSGDDGNLRCATDENGADHGLRGILGRMRHLFRHVSHGIESGKKLVSMSH